MDFSLIVPCYNEADNLPLFFSTATACLDASELSYEIVFVNDGSSDGSERLLREFAEQHDDIKVICFSRNFGKEPAIYAGLKHAEGDVLCIIDADMQQEPATALEMYRQLTSHPDYDCVAAVQVQRREGFMVRHLKKHFYRILQRANGDGVIPNASDFRVFKRIVGEALLQMPEYHRFSKGMFAWVGFRTLEFPYTPNPRHAGESKWRVRDLFAYALEGIISFTTLPLTMAAYLGFAASIIAMIYLVRVLLEKLIRGIPVPGYPTLVSIILLLGGLQLFVLGVMGEYLGRDYIEGKHRPVYIERDYLTSANLREDANERVQEDPARY